LWIQLPGRERVKGHVSMANAGTTMDAYSPRSVQQRIRSRP